MKLTIAHLQQIEHASDARVGEAILGIASAVEIEQETHRRVDHLLRLDRDDASGAFVQVSPVQSSNRWHVEVCGGHEATLRAVREPVLLDEAIGLLRRFMNGEPGLGIDAAWRDLDGRSWPTAAKFIAAACVVMMILVLIDRLI